MKEIWKDIPNYEGLYQISNLGRVKSLKREAIQKSTGHVRVVNEKILKNTLSRNGYYSISLSKNGIKKLIHIHKLLAICFLNHDTNSGLFVDHINNKRTDNRLENLQLITPRKNSTKDRVGKTSKFIGVDYDKNQKKWRSRIDVNGKSIFLGRFNKEKDAYNAYIKKLDEINGR